MSTTNQDGMQAALTCKKIVPSIREDTAKGETEKRQIVLKGDFLIFTKGRKEPIKLTTTLEFKEDPSTVEIIQQVINIDNLGEQCLLTLHSNKQGRLDEYLEELESKKQKQLDEYMASLPQENDDEEYDD